MLTVIVVFATSVVAELLQALLPLGGTSNVDDIILNTVGGVLGAACASLVLTIRRRQTSPNTRRGESIPSSSVGSTGGGRG